MKYKLISFCPISPGENKGYYVYGHEDLSKNVQLAICLNRVEAMAKAHEWKRVPVWEGEAYHLILEKLGRD